MTQATLDIIPSRSRTYGTYRFEAGSARSGGMWFLDVEPAVAVRAKRVFGRASATTAGRVCMTHTAEVARDLEWFMERFPLRAANTASQRKLREGATAHRAKEATIASILDADDGYMPRGAHEPDAEIRDYQRQAVKLLWANSGLLLTDAKGLGKTFQGLLAGAGIEDGLPMLVSCPVHLASRWELEVREKFPTMTYGTAKKTTVPEGWTPDDLPDVFIVPYSRLDGWSHHLAGQVRTVVFDEVQDLRHGQATTKGRAAKMVCERAVYNLGLTATPIYNYGGEVFNILSILAPGNLGDYTEFSREWGTEVQGGLKITAPAALGSYLREQGLMLGRTRKQVGRELPAHIPVPVEVDSDPAVFDQVRGEVAELARLILSKSGTSMERLRAGGEIDMRMRQATGIAKAPFVAAYTNMLLESEPKIILCGWHRAVYDIWMEQLAHHKPVMYTGSESPKQKDEALAAFIEGDARVLIMSLRSGSGIEGLQTAAKVVVFGELDWSPQTHGQIIGRLERDGMGDEPVLAYYLNALDGSDPAVMEVLGVKRNQAEPIVNPDGKLSDQSSPDMNRTRMLAEQILRKADQ